MTDTTFKIIQVFAIFIAMVIQTLYQKGFFKNLLYKTKKELEVHTDTSVRKLNGTATSIIMAFPSPCFMLIADKDPDTGKTRFLYSEVNLSYERLTKLSRREFISRTELEVGVIKKYSDENYSHNIIVTEGSNDSYTFDEVLVPGDTNYIKVLKVRLCNSDGSTKGILGFVIEPKFRCWKDDCPLKDVPGVLLAT